MSLANLKQARSTGSVAAASRVPETVGQRPRCLRQRHSMPQQTRMGGRLELRGKEVVEREGRGWQGMEKDCDDCVPLRWAMMCKLVGRFEAVA